MKCQWHLCEKPADYRVTGWLLVDRILYCPAHALDFCRVLVNVFGWTFPLNVEPLT